MPKSKNVLRKMVYLVKDESEKALKKSRLSDPEMTLSKLIRVLIREYAKVS